jgi:preprotein translocase subunit YajC
MKTLRNIGEILAMPFILAFAVVVLAILHFEMQRAARKAMRARNEEPL